MRQSPSLKDVDPSRTADTHDLLFKLMCDYRPDDKATIQKDIVMHVEYTLARTRLNFTNRHAYQATAYSLRDRLVERFNDTHAYFADTQARMCYYISLEFLVGRSLKNAVCNLGLESVYTEALSELGYNLEALYDEEKDAALGNGGLGRLAACFMDSLAKENLPAWGYGLRYTYGMFEQKIHKGEQVEVPDNWLADGNPWEIERLDVQYKVGFYGHTEMWTDDQGTVRHAWHPKDTVVAVAYDTPIPGYGTRNTINIRLWASRPDKEFDMDSFNKGDYIGAVALKQESENITSVLYPNDNTYSGKELRLKQQYLLVSATLQDIIRRFKRQDLPLTQFHEKVTIQLNDTHPALGIPELMRIFVDEEEMPWDVAWGVVSKVYNYTNHTVLPEALEKWSADLVKQLLPRHLDIIYGINHYFLDGEVAAKWPHDMKRRCAVSIIEESFGEKRVCMAHLAIVGSQYVNGVAALHSDLIKAKVFNKFYELWPHKFQNKTNGVTPRRWVDQANPGLSALITELLGDSSWVSELSRLSGLKAFADDPKVQKRWMDVKLRNKTRLAYFVKRELGIDVDPRMMFDVQIKRIHEYKRQLMNVLGVIFHYNRIRQMSEEELSDKVVPRAVFFAGKAAPGYFMAKRIIKLIHCVADVVNNDARTSNYLKVIYIPNYNVRMAELIIPANDISQHISTAGTEASGTSCMKFAMNGGLIVGTLDGANVEIAEEVGAENMFIFGLKADEVARAQGELTFSEKHKTSGVVAHRGADPRWIETLEVLSSGSIAFGTPQDIQPILQAVLPSNDRYVLAHDFPRFLDAVEKATETYRDEAEWCRRCIMCTSMMGKFSSDNTIRQYATELWHIEPHTLPEDD